MHSSSGGNRIEFLDGLRGLAISLVVLFHAYARWPELAPYGNTFSDVKVFAYGWLGVQLFFLISGFVIFLTLDRCATLMEFLVRRWLRLFPAMLICSLFVWYTASLFPERPCGSPTVDQLIPGLTFIDPHWLSLAGISAKPVEGAFWSLFVEAQFYLIAGFSYFILGGRRSAIFVLLFLFALANLIGPIRANLGDNIIFHCLSSLTSRINSQLYGWFAGGALLYIYYTRKRYKALVLGLAVIAVAVCTEHGIWNAEVKLPAALVAMVFVGALISQPVRRVLSRQWFLFLGYISYPLYLVHENIMVASIVKVGKWAPLTPSILMPLAPISFVMFIAWLIAAYVEPVIKKALSTGYAATLAAKRLPV
jgi:peptidoglycan/LPS O-acetylase OafA/YrhL